MAYPPERITVKRRRDEDPVEALCECHHLKMSWPLASGSLTSLSSYTTEEAEAQWFLEVGGR